MPLELPVLDDRNFEQLLAETKRRIPAHTPEWTNYNVESDPGITLVQLFAFLTDNLLYRANRIPERNRLKFLQLLGIPLQPAAAAEGIITIQNERGPVAALQLEKGIVVAAGSTQFLTRDNLTVLPLQAQVYYKRPIAESDPRYAEYQLRYEALLAAMSLAEEATGVAATLKPVFYESVPMTQPSATDPAPVLDMVKETTDQALYLALLAPKNVDPATVRAAIANKTLSIGIAPALSDEVAPLLPQRRAQREPLPDLMYEIAAPGLQTAVAAGDKARYTRLLIRQQPDVLTQEGIVQVVLPAAADLATWTFPEPMQEGTGAFPPALEDEEIQGRLVTWLRIRLPQQTEQQGVINGRLSWVGINAARVVQAVPISNELLGSGSGEPDQAVALANTPVIAHTVRLEVEDGQGSWQLWRLTDDLLAADLDDRVFILDRESGQVRFGTGINGLRPPRGQRIRASYEYGGGIAGNVAIGDIKKSQDVRLQGGYKVTNPLPTMGGDRGETTSEGERNIPLHLRHRDRLVTQQDFADITRRTPGVDVGRVEVLPLFKPTTPPATNAAGIVTLLVIPETDALQPRWPTPDRLFLQQVCSHLDGRRLVTTEIYVRGPVYLSVHLSIGLQVQEGHYRDDVLQAVRERLAEYLSALPPGGPEETGWPLNRRLLKKDLEAVVTRVTGVEYVDSMEMGVGTSLGLDEFDLTGLHLPLLATLALREGEAEPLAAILSGGDTGDTAPIVQPVPVPVARSTC
ncbi:MAG: putative baseplate assembly protein [Ardenticatenaceae bacterium]|nr:putative baseplate assembly protein [Ardenticatenaceae bacterium]